MVRVIHIASETPAAAPRDELDEWLSKGYQILDDDLAKEFYDTELEPGIYPARDHAPETKIEIEAEVTKRLNHLAQTIGMG